MTSSSVPWEAFQVQGMSCQHCVRAVTASIHRHDASAQVEVDLGRGQVRVHSRLARDRLATLIRDEGYTVGS